jgi:hypothetical protein
MSNAQIVITLRHVLRQRLGFKIILYRITLSFSRGAAAWQWNDSYPLFSLTRGALL